MLGHSWGTKLKFLGHSWCKLWAQLGKKVTWGIVGANTVGAHLRQSRGENDLKHSLGKLNTLGAQLGHSWGKKLLGAHLGEQKKLEHSWGTKLRPEEADWQR